MPFRTERHHETLRLSPFGDWTIQHVGEIERSLETLALDGVRHIQIDLSGIVSLDLSGAWLIHDLRVRSHRVLLHPCPVIAKHGVDMAELSPAVLRDRSERRLSHRLRLNRHHGAEHGCPGDHRTRHRNRRCVRRRLGNRHGLSRGGGWQG